MVLCLLLLALGLAALLRLAFLRSLLLDLRLYFPVAGLDAVGLVLALGLPGVVERLGLLTPVAEFLVIKSLVLPDKIYPVESVADGSPGLTVVSQWG